MKQLTQKLKNGAMQVLEVPVPDLRVGTVLVRNHYSVISAGTEGSTVKTARAGYLAKAKERPQQAKQVLDTLRSQGITQTYRAVMKKLDAYSPLGYSTAGEVIDIAPDVTSFRIGDRVACAGNTACHAEIIAVPVNLCVLLPLDTDLKHAAYNTLGAIAMQGVRQADLRLGECCVVIGMGLLGQLTALILRVAGVRTIGVDIAPVMVEIGAKHCLDLAMRRDDPSIEKRIEEFTGGIGCDAVIITAATDSADPVNFAGAISRKRGTVVIVGNVPTGFDREPHYYRKELQLRMSCSYGPGRYDPLYEDKGVDYPPAYVRWTEKRNMEAFQEMIRGRRIDIEYLTTHVFPLLEAPAAYDLVLGKKEPFIGILIEYEHEKKPEDRTTKVTLRERALGSEKTGVRIGFIGAGSYAQGSLLPNIPREVGVEMVGVATVSGAGARTAGDRFRFGYCTSSAEEILRDERINTVFIATRHDSHGDYVIRALRAGKNVFVEKPLCSNEEELSAIAETYAAATTPEGNQPLLMVGFNRRFAPLAYRMRKEFGSGPMATIYRINAGFIPRDSWVQDTATGGRIVGEVCHFIDFLTWLSGSSPDSVYAVPVEPSQGIPDTLSLTLTFRNGSIGTISYFANGDKSLPKERVEGFAGGVSAVLDDFRSLTVHAGGNKLEKRLFSQDKGQREQVLRFIEAVRSGMGNPIPFDDSFRTTSVTFKVLESLRTRKRISIEL
jgi:polar amino acid transport system substrate-binding protein